MKKFLILTFALVLVLCACGKNEDTTTSVTTTKAPAVVTTQKAETTAAPKEPDAPYRENWVYFSDVDFTEYGDVLGDRQTQTLVSYLPVLENEVAFNWQVGRGDVIKKVTMSEFHKALWGENEASADLMLYGLMTFNFNGDATELILDFEDMGGTYLVLSYYEDENGEKVFFGTDFGIRGFDFLESGVYRASYSVAAGSYRLLMIDNGMFFEYEVAAYDNDAGEYTVKGEKVDKAAFDEFAKKYDSESAKWVSFEK